MITLTSSIGEFLDKRVLVFKTTDLQEVSAQDASPVVNNTATIA